MEKKDMEIAKKETLNEGENKISRKEAIKKTGFAAVSVATMMVLLSKNAKAGGGYGDGPSCSPTSDYDSRRHRRHH